MKTRLIIPFIILISFITGCEKDDATYMSDIMMGTWIRNDLHSDTLIFGSTTNDNWFELRRGFAKIDGNNVPLLPTGLFDFKLKKDSIRIHNLASSSMAYETFYFKIEGNNLDIGNFIERNNTILHFSRK